MDQKFTLQLEDLSWSRSKGNIGISADANISVLSSPMGNHQGRHSKKNEEEEHTRKRIRVACSRCRKRKIKCSGPIGGEDQPCMNCKTAGTNTSCAFELAGSVKVELSKLQYASQEYPYNMHSSVSSVYPQEQQYFANCGTTTLYQDTYSGAARYQRDVMSSMYTNPLPVATAYYGYSQPVSTYNQYPGQWNVAQGIEQTSQPEQIVQWSASYDPGCNTYLSTAPRVSRSMPPLAVHLSATNQASNQYPAMDTLASALPERMLPRPRQLSANSPPTIVLPRESEDQAYWSVPQDSQTDSDSSRHSSQDTSSVGSSTSRSDVTLDHNNSVNEDPGGPVYPHFATTLLEPPCPAPILHEPVPYHHHQQLPERYNYNYSSPRPVVCPPPSNKNNSSVGNHTYSHLPYRGRGPLLGTLQYKLHNGVPKAASRIAIEAAGGGRSAERD